MNTQDLANIIGIENEVKVRLVRYADGIRWKAIVEVLSYTNMGNVRRNFVGIDRDLVVAITIAVEQRAKYLE